MSKGRVGDWMQTYTGRQFWPLDPRPADIDIMDIAHHLSLICRFGGASREFYSVAQHSVLVSERCDPADALWGLLHDAAEAYVGDMVRPLKRSIGSPFEWIEKGVQRTICDVFDLEWEKPDSVRVADERMLFTEARDLVHLGPNGWSHPAEPYADEIVPMSPVEAETAFRLRFAELRNEENRR